MTTPMTPVQLCSVIRFHLSELGARNAHHEFEHLARHLARARVYSNILPATGPVSAGGDGGKDFETFKTAILVPIAAVPSFGNRASGTRMAAFACTLERTNLPAKIRSDIETIVAKGHVDEIVYFCEANLPAAKRHTSQKWALTKHNVELQIFDGTAIAELLTERDIYWIAQEYLHLPAEHMPTLDNEDDWYGKCLARWLIRMPIVISNSDFAEIKFGLRRATFHNDARPRLLFWIGLMEQFLDAAAPRPLQRVALYEIAVAWLRGKGDLTPQLNRVRDYFHDVDNFLMAADLQDAATLVVYAFGGWALGQFAVDEHELFGWRKAIADLLDTEIRAAEGPGRKSGLLRVRAFLNTLPERAGGAPLTEQAFDDWNLMLDEAEKTTVFPIQDFADHLAKITPATGQHPRFASLVERVDALVAKQSGPAASAEKIFERALAYYEQDRLLEAIRELHRAQVRWFTGDAMPRFQRAAFLLAHCYLDLGFAYASKHVALAAAFLARHAEEPEVAHTLPEMLFLAADADDGAGNSLSFLQILLVALNAHSHLDPDPLNFDKHPELPANFGQVAALRGLATRFGPEYAEVVDELLAVWPAPLRDPVVQASNDPAGFWHNESWDETWDTIQDSFIGRPFGDLGPIREITWMAFDIRWVVAFDNSYVMTPLAEEFVAALQIAQVTLAGLDACVLPTEIRCNLSVAPEALVVDMPDAGRNAAEGGLTLEISLAGASEPSEPHDTTAAVLGLVAVMLRSTSVLPDPQLVAIMENGLLNAAGRLHIGRPYRELYREFVPSELFGEGHRRASVPPASDCTFRPRQHELLAPPAAPGPTYTRDTSLENIKTRYETGEAFAQFTVRALMSDPDKRRFLQGWHNDGLLDWEILSIVTNAALNIRHPLSDDVEPTMEDVERMRAALDDIEQPSDARHPDEFTDELLLLNRKAFYTAFLRGWQLYAPPATRDAVALENFLSRRYALRIDDVDHIDLFNWTAN